MGKKAKITKFEEEEEEGQAQVQEQLEATKTDKKAKKETETVQEEEEDGAAGLDGEKRKRKRKRTKASADDGAGGADVDMTGASAAGKTSKSKIQGGSGEIVGQSSLPPAATAYTSATVYIEGVPYEATEKEVRAFFANCGMIKSLRLPTWQDTGRLRGYGHVEFDSEEGALKVHRPTCVSCMFCFSCMDLTPPLTPSPPSGPFPFPLPFPFPQARELDGTYLLKRYIKVDLPKVPKMLLGERDGPAERPVGCKQIFVKNIPYDSTEEDISDTFKVCGPIEEIRLARWGHTNQLKGMYVCMYGVWALGWPLVSLHVCMWACQHVCGACP